MRLFDLKTGTSTRRVRIFMAEKNFQLPLVEIDMDGGENQRPEYVAINPMGTMPVLELDDGTYIAESVAICRYIEEELAPTPNLFGIGARERAEIEMWNRRMEFEILLPIMAAFQHLSPFWKGKRTQVEGAGLLAREKAADRMIWLDRELSRRPFIAGARYTIADITTQSAFVLGKNTGTRIDSALANLSHWYQDVTSRPTARA